VTMLAPVLQAFFTDKLIRQRDASPHTIKAYRDAFRLLLAYARTTTGTEPSQLALAQMDATVITGFLDHLQTDRGNTARTRNARLAAIRSLFRYAAVAAPDDAETIQRVLAISGKRTSSSIINFLDEEEAQALLGACERGTWIGRRDHAMLLLALRAGLRVSELTKLACSDIQLGTGSHVRCTGKGRKERATPLKPATGEILRTWLSERGGDPGSPLFCTRQGRALSPDAVEDRIAKYHQIASTNCPTLASKRITPHTLRHSAAMALLHAGVDIAVIALWLGHENIQSTQTYLHADLKLKERALARTAPADTPASRYQPSDSLLAFLESL
jgi:integrase/recombinase XerD